MLPSLRSIQEHEHAQPRHPPWLWPSAVWRSIPHHLRCSRSCLYGGPPIGFAPGQLGFGPDQGPQAGLAHTLRRTTHTEDRCLEESLCSNRLNTNGSTGRAAARSTLWAGHAKSSLRMQTSRCDRRLCGASNARRKYWGSVSNSYSYSSSGCGSNEAMSSGVHLHRSCPTQGHYLTTYCIDEHQRTHHRTTTFYTGGLRELLMCPGL